MLVELSVENFKSFEDLQTISFITDPEIDSIEHSFKINDIDILNLSVIYGANASGKSNLIKVLKFIQEVLINGLSYKSRNFYSKTQTENRDRPSRFEIRFSYRREFYIYGFSALLNKQEILEEYLYLYQDNKALPVFERDKNRIILGNFFDDSTHARVQVYILDFLDNKENQSRLFLDNMNHGKRLLNSLRLFRNSYLGIIEKIKITSSDFSRYELVFYRDIDLEALNSVLPYFDTGITQAYMEKVDVEEFIEVVGQRQLKIIQKMLDQQIGSSSSIAGRSEDWIFKVKRSEDFEEYELIRFSHEDSKIRYELFEESKGTRKLINFIDILYLSDGFTYVIDEMDNSLHPLLIEQFIKMFFKNHSQDDTQLIFTTHNPLLLKKGLLREDAIWFVNKKNDRSELYSLNEFSQIEDSEILNNYLIGRYKAIPRFKMSDPYGTESS